MSFEHKSVLLDEAVEGLNLRKGGIYVDGTLGGAGHSLKILQSLDDIRLIGIDRDETALAASKERLKAYGARVELVKDNFKNIAHVLDGLGVEKIDGFLLDLGVSSPQFDEEDRGFSYRFNSRLDMRMDRTAELDAYKVVNSYDQDRLAGIIFRNSDERWAKRIAEFIVKERRIKPIETCFELVELIKRAIPHGARREGGHPAKRTFQALRMEVNGELENISESIRAVVPRLNIGGRISIITFHSIEDRLVKQEFMSFQKACTCPPSFPVCVCGNSNKLKAVGKVRVPGNEELKLNPRATSAKLRVAERI